MVYTYTIDWESISDNDEEYYNPSNFVGEDNIEVLSAEARWIGESSSSTSYTYSWSDTESISVESTDTTLNTSNENSNSGTNSTSLLFPDVPSGYDFDGHDLTITGTSTEGEWNVLYHDLHGDTNTQSGNGADSHLFHDSSISNTNYVGEERSINADGMEEVEITATTYGIQTGYTPNEGILEIPPPPSGYSHHRHRVEIDVDGEAEYDFPWDSGTVTSDSNFSEYSDYTGDNISVTVDDGHSASMEVRTRGRDSYTSTEDTDDPSITGDVSASYSGTLDDGEQSSWQTLSGLDAETSNQFIHDIDGSGDGDFQFRFDWDYTLPSTLYEQNIVINGTTYSVALVDPDDDALEYDMYRTSVNGDIVAYDLVNPSDGDALPYYIYHSDHGKLAFREL